MMRNLQFTPARFGTRSGAAARRAHMPMLTALQGEVWRKPSCACGGSCPRCTEEKALQRKPAISSPGDAFEREADAVADQVMRMAQPATIGELQPTVQRRASVQAQDSDLDSDTAAQAASSGGTPLPDSLRSFFEPRFGQDFGAVRIHDDGAGATAAQAVQARAYTYGSHIVFDAGEYAPDTAHGKQLLAHELTHVVQQGGTAPAIQRDDKETCKKREPLYGWDNIRNISRERLRVGGFVFCGPDNYFNRPDQWELWVHPVKGVLHYQVKWPDDPAPEPQPEPKPDDRQKRCVDPCLENSKDEGDCKQCCEDMIPAEDTQCRRSCEVGCSMKL